MKISRKNFIDDLLKNKERKGKKGRHRITRKVFFKTKKKKSNQSLQNIFYEHLNMNDYHMIHLNKNNRKLIKYVK